MISGRRGALALVEADVVADAGARGPGDTAALARRCDLEPATLVDGSLGLSGPAVASVPQAPLHLIAVAILASGDIHRVVLEFGGSSPKSAQSTTDSNNASLTRLRS